MQITKSSLTCAVCQQALLKGQKLDKTAVGGQTKIVHLSCTNQPAAAVQAVAQPAIANAKESKATNSLESNVVVVASLAVLAVALVVSVAMKLLG